MNAIKKILIYGIVFISIFLFSCRSIKTIHVKNNSHYPILDSLSYVIFPDDNYGTEGNYYFQKIVSYKDSIVPYLIEEITDTLTSNIRIADVFNLKNGDIAVYLLPYVSSKEIPMRTILFDEFKELRNKNLESDFFDSIYYRLFSLNSEKQNYKNRIRLQNRIREWYLNNNHGYVDKTILDSLQYVVYLPDENYSSYGDSICERVIKMGEVIVPDLIEKITDVTKTKMKFADVYDITVSDVAITLIQYIYVYQSNKIFPIRDLLIKEFYKNNGDGDFDSDLYYRIFFFNSSKQNYKNRIRFQKRLREWYLNSNHGCTDKTILDSLRYIVALPDEDYSSFGDSISERIVKMGDIIVPELIERITDVTKTKMKISDVYDVTVSDAAITLIQYIYLYQYDKEPPIRDMLIDEFYNNIDDDDFTYSLYYKTFYSNSSSENYKNRIRFYIRMKKWYKETKIQYNCVEKNQLLLDSMKYIYALPDDYFFSPKGDSICERIINKGNSIVPCLIDKITDNTKTNVRIADRYNYSVGDVAVFLLSNIYSLEKKSIPLRKIIISEFYNNEDNGDFFETLYNITFFSHSKKINYLNKTKLQERIKEWYLNNKDGILIEKSHE